jgi:Holliday junction resolvase
MNEAEIVNRIKAYLKTLEGCFAWKEHGGIYGTGGIPDIIVCFNGRFIAFECKTETGKTTALQAITINKIREAGGVAGVVRSVDEAKAILNKLQNNSNGGI